MRSRNLAVLTALMLTLAACGGEDAAEEPAAEPTEEPAAEEPTEEEEPAEEAPAEEEPAEEPAEEEPAEAEAAASLDCNAIEAMVPYAPGGGSDQQVRRLEGPVSETLGVDINVVYREGAEGAVAWTALMEAEPDGCTVSNVVIPNIILAAEQEGAPFAADDFTFLAFTETAPNALVVANDSEFETIEQFIEAAEADPGGLTVGGSGAQGQLTADQMMEATGIEVTYIPLEGGVGDTLPQIQGGHIDAALFGASHAVTNSDTIRAIALSGTEQSPALEGIPTFDELGHTGVDVATTWGIIAPPGVPDDIRQLWNDAINQAVESEEVNQALIDGGLTPVAVGPEETDELMAGYIDTFSGQM